MRRRPPPTAAARLVILLSAIGACTSPPHQNVAHPTYGYAEYKTDLAQCRNDNSSIITTQGYDVQTQVIVDEPKSAACMTAHGWQTAPAK